MEFDIHKKARFSDAFTPEEYKSAQVEYYRHLAAIDFSKAKSLIKYFGDSFFHDAELTSLAINPSRNKLDLQFTRINDLEDFNDIRRKHALPDVSVTEYNKNPIAYNCSFRGVTMLEGKLDISEDTYIMDTELHSGMNNSEFKVLISFSKEIEIGFTCSKCIVRLVNSDRIAEYSGGLRKSIPYCALCRSKLLSEKSLVPYCKS